MQYIVVVMIGLAIIHLVLIFLNVLLDNCVCGVTLRTVEFLPIDC